MKITLKAALPLLSLVTTSYFTKPDRTSEGKIKTPVQNENLEIIHKYLDIVLIENNKGKGLEKLLDDNFQFTDPMTSAASAHDFISKVQPWIGVPKTYSMHSQIVMGDEICSFYTIAIHLPDGRTGSFELADYVSLKKGKLYKENVFFFDPAGFAKFFGIRQYLDKYL